MLKTSVWTAQLDALPWEQAQVALRRLPGQVVVVQTGQQSADRLAEWAALVRTAQRTPAVAVAAQLLNNKMLQVLGRAGPLLLVLTADRRTTRAGWVKARRQVGRLRSPTLRVALLDVPLCVDGLGQWQGDVAIVSANNYAKPLTCQGCGNATRCPGPGLSQLRPRPRPSTVSNQFDVIVGQGPVDANTVLVDLGHGPLACHTLAGQAKPAVVRRALRLGQLYLDTSDQPRLDDFAAQLRLLVRVGAGQPWQIAPGQPFAAEEVRLMRVLAQFGGVVVDVGAGPVRYVQALAQAAARHQLRYVAVEPDAAALQASQSALPSGTFVRGVAEHLPLATAIADVVMFLRSWNHLSDVTAAMREAARVCKPGGRLVLVDNVTFGLVRTADQVQRAHAISTDQTPFEHFRNASADQAWHMVQRALGIRAQRVQIHDVGPGTSNQWLLEVTVGSAVAQQQNRAGAVANRGSVS